MQSALKKGIFKLKIPNQFAWLWLIFTCLSLYLKNRMIAKRWASLEWSTIDSFERISEKNIIELRGNWVEYIPLVTLKIYKGRSELTLRNQFSISRKLPSYEELVESPRNARRN
jgi:hypothetical protein